MEVISIVRPGRIFLNLINFAFQMRGKAFKHLAAGAVLAIGLAMSAGCSKTEPGAVPPRHTINVHWALSPGGLGDMGYNDIIFAGISVAEACTGTPGVLIYTATNPNETSKAENFDPELNVYLSDRFSAAFRQAVGKRADWTMAELYYELYNHTPGSHVTVYNSDNYGNLYSSSLSEFLE